MRTRAGQHHQIELTNIRSGTSFDLETSVIPLTHFTFHCEVVPSTGGSTISQRLNISGPLGFVFGPIAGERIAASFESLLAGLATKAEGAEQATTGAPAPAKIDQG